MTTAPLIKNDPNSHLNYQHNIARETNEISTQQDHYSFLLKLILLSTCIFIDLILNATSEFQILDNNSINTDDTNNYYSDNSRKELHRKHILLCSLQIFSQVSTFAILFSQLCDTFPFKIGLLGTLLERFKVMLILHLIYILLTFIISGIRLSTTTLQSTNEMTMLDLWDTTYYTFLSFTHKLVAPFFYAYSLRSSIELFSPEYYSKTTWYQNYIISSSSGETKN